MRVFAIAQILHLVESDGHAFGELLAASLCQIIRDHRIITGCVAERSGGKTLSCFKRGLAEVFNLFQNCVVIIGRADDRNGLVVLGS